MAIPPGAFARQFRALTPTEAQAFVAAVWRARGHETAVEDGVVIARRDGAVRRLRVVGGWPLRPVEADVWVGRRDTDWARSRAEAAGAEFCSPAALRDRFLYAIDRATADRIARRFFGAGIEALAARRDRRAVTAATVVASVLVMVALGLAGPGALGVDAGVGPADAGAAGPDAVTVNATALEADRTYPPGLSPSGVSNASRLVTAHRDRVVDAPHVVRYEYHGPPGDRLKIRAIRHTATLRMHDRTTYHYVVEETTVGADGVPLHASQTIYRNDSYPGIHNEVRVEDGTYRYSHRIPRSDFVHEAPRMVLEDVLDVYGLAVSSSGTETTEVEVLGSRRYRVRATGRPDALAGEATDFSATAYLTLEGRLVHLDVSYAHVESDARVSVRVTYESVGSVERSDLPPPRWLDDIWANAASG